MISVAVIIGSESDEKIVRPNYLDKLYDAGVGYDLSVCSADRNLDVLPGLVVDCLAEGAELFMCFAGLSPALPRLVAGLAPRNPVIGSCADENLGDQRAITNTPPGRPIIYVGAGVEGLRKAVDLTVLLLAWKDSSLYELQAAYLDKQAAAKPPQPHKERRDPEKERFG